MTTKTEICNLAISRLGDKNSIESIDRPKKQTEIVCAKWYDISRKTALKYMMPNFARKRDKWALSLDYTPAFGYKYAYKYPSDCLKILGIGNLRNINTGTLENGYYLTNEYYENGLEVRYVYDVTDETRFSSDFIQLFSWFLARDICIELTSNTSKLKMIEDILPMKIAEFCGVDSQENPPIRISRSARYKWRNGYIANLEGKV